MPSSAAVSLSTALMPTGPEYVDGCSDRRSDSVGSDDEPLTGTGRVCGVSASNAPNVTSSVTPARRARPTTVEQNARHLMFGSGARNSRTSRSAPGGRAR